MCDGVNVSAPAGSECESGQRAAAARCGAAGAGQRPGWRDRAACAGRLVDGGAGDSRES